MCHTLVLGIDNEDYRTIGFSMATLLRALLGSHDFKTMCAGENVVD